LAIYFNDKNKEQRFSLNSKTNQTGVQMGLKNTIRNVFNIRKERALAPAGPKPQIGSSIVRERLRIKLKYHITDKQWDWFIERGWRSVDMRTERREYKSVPDKVLVKLLDVDGEAREILHQRLFRKSSSSKEQAMRPEKTDPAVIKKSTGSRELVNEITQV